jgi:hypothetical protein
MSIAPVLTTEAAKASPVKPRRFNQRERMVLESVSESSLNQNIVQATIDFATAGNRTVADHSLGVNIPAGAVVLRVLTKVTADLDSTSSTGTAQLFLGASSGGKSVGSAIACDGSSVIQPFTAETLTAANMTVSTSAVALTVKIATNAITSTSGKISYIVEYVVPA